MWCCRCCWCCSSSSMSVFWFSISSWHGTLGSSLNPSRWMASALMHKLSSIRCSAAREHWEGLGSASTRKVSNGQASKLNSPSGGTAMILPKFPAALVPKGHLGIFRHHIIYRPTYCKNTSLISDVLFREASRPLASNIISTLCQTPEARNISVPHRLQRPGSDRIKIK